MHLVCFHYKNTGNVRRFCDNVVVDCRYYVMFIHRANLLKRQKLCFYLKQNIDSHWTGHCLKSGHGFFLQLSFPVNVAPTFTQFDTVQSGVLTGAFNER